MKNKLFWPTIIVAVIIIVESVMLISNAQTKKPVVDDNNTEDIQNSETKTEYAVGFEWLEEEDGKPVLMLKANRDVSIDAIDLYIAYKNAKVNSIINSDELPKPSFSKISTEKSLVVMNYLISEPEGFKITAGQSVKVVKLGISPISTEAADFSIDARTQVVENGTVKVLPFTSNNLIVNSTL